MDGMTDTDLATSNDPLSAFAPDPAALGGTTDPTAGAAQGADLLPQATRGPAFGANMPWEQASQLIKQYESYGGQNVMNEPYLRGDPTSTASGPWQITGTNLRAYGQRLGIDISPYRFAMDAPPEVQEKIARALYEERGFAPWADSNPRLRNALGLPDPQGGAQPTVASTSEELGRREAEYEQQAGVTTSTIEQQKRDVKAAATQYKNTLNTASADIESRYAPFIAAQQERDQKEQALRERQANLQEQQAQQVRSDADRLEEFAWQTPTRQAVYATTMHMTPMLALLTAIGGAFTKNSGMAMLGALNGIVQGVNQGSENLYNDAMTRWKNIYQGYKDHAQGMQDYYNKLVESYGTRADAQSKASERARAAFNDSLAPEQLKIATGDKLFGTQMDMGQTLSNLDLSLLKIKEAAVAQAAKRTADAQMSDDAVTMAAYDHLQYGVPLTELSTSRGLNRTQIMNKLPEVFQQLHADDPKYKNPDGSVNRTALIRDAAQQQHQSLVAYRGETQAARSAGVIAGKVRMAEGEILGWISQARQLSKKVPRTKYTTFNKAWMAALRGVNDPDAIRFYNYTNSIMNAYDILSARGGTDIDKRKRTLDMLSTAYNDEGYNAALDAIVSELKVAGQAAVDSVNNPLGTIEPLPGEDEVVRGVGIDSQSTSYRSSSRAPWDPLPTGPRGVPGGAGVGGQAPSVGGQAPSAEDPLGWRR